MTHDPTRDCQHGCMKGKCEVCDLQAEVERLKAAQPALPPMHASGLVAIKTLLSRDPCAHAKLAIEIIDAMLSADPPPAPVKTYHDGKPWPVAQPVVSLQCANCVVTIETLNDKVTQLMAAREPLTDAQILAANYPDGEENEATIAAPDVELIGFARAIEAKLKEKNT